MTDDNAFQVFVGFEEGQRVAYDVCVESLRLTSSAPQHLSITPLCLPDLRRRGLYWRGDDPLASTEFTYTRFLVPYLVGFSGWALYLDLDMFARRDIAELFALRDDGVAVMVVPHRHVPLETVKMDGRPQTSYPRKNWSSLMLFNAPSCTALTPSAVSERPAKWLHRFEWLPDSRIGYLPEAWNWLEGHSSGAIDPAIVHYTRGGPWFDDWRNAAFADEWRALASRLTSAPS